MGTRLHKNLLYKDSNFIVEWEELEDCLFLHCNVFNWSLSTLRTMYAVFAELRHIALSRGFSSMSTITPNPKFAKLFGGETINSFVHEGKEYEVIVWVLK